MAVEKLLPQNVEAEAGVLGSLLIDPEAIVQIADFLKADDFYSEAHRTIYQAAVDLYESHEPADLVTLCDELGRRGKLDEVGGASYVSSLANQVPTSRNVRHYAQIVERTAILRRLIHAAGQIAGVAYSEPDAETALEQAERFIFEVSQRSSRSDFDSLGTILRDYIDRLDQLHEQRGAIVGVATGFGDLDKMTSGLQKSDLIILAARPAVGKCLTAQTLIDDPLTGERLTIEECVRRRQRRVFGLSVEGQVRATAISDWVDSGIQPVFRVRTRSGRSVEVTGHHPFLTASGWVPLHALSVGNAIAVPCSVPAFGSEERWPRELVRLLAYFIAESGLTVGSAEFTTTDPLLIGDFRAIIAEHFPPCAIHQERSTYIVVQPRAAEAMHARGSVMPANPVASWLKHLGLWGKLARQKRFPACVWSWSKRYLAEFLRVLMSCSGSIFSVAGNPRIECTVASAELADDMLHAFVRFGIIARRYVTSQGTHRVEITAPDAVRRYQEAIGWIGEKSQRLIGECLQPPKRLGAVGRTPVETGNLVGAVAGNRSVPSIALARSADEPTGTGTYAGYSSHTRRSSLPRHGLRLASAARVRGDPRLDDPHLQALSSPELHWDPITAIEPLGEQQVYDLTVPDGENFIAQDIIVHNTAMALSLAHNAALRFGHSVAIFSLEMSKEQLATRLLSMDAQVDQQRLRTGYIDDDEWQRISESVGRLAETQIYIDDTPGIPLAEMRSKARRLMLERGFDLLIVDYLQLMQGSGGANGRGHENRVQEISEISRGLKVLARELNVPVMALSQLSRAVESRTDKKPQLSDLRESGCLAGETPVYLPDAGVYRPIAELVGQSGFRVLALNTQTWKLEPAVVSRAFATGHKPVYRLTTRLGRSLRATANHKFLTLSGWRRLDELDVGTRLALPRRLPGPERAATMRDEELALLGHLIGDGCVLPSHCVQYTTAEAALGELVAYLATQVFGDAVAPRIQRDSVGARSWYQVFLPMTARATHGVHNPVGDWLRRLNIYGLRSHEKRVPDQVFAQPADGIARFLRHLWATDGCIHLSIGQIHSIKVYYATSSCRLAHDVQSLLLRLGINATILRYPQKGKGRDQYHVKVSGRPDVVAFLNRVGALGQHKVKHAIAISDFYDSHQGKTNRDVLPREVWERIITPAMLSGSITEVDLKLNLGWVRATGDIIGQSLSRERASRVATAVRSEELHQLADSDVYWDQIAGIEPDGEADVYDLTVEELHNFIAGDISTHNSIEQDSDIVMFIYRDEVYNPDTDRKNIADIIVAKHRNGPIGSVSLYFQAAQTRYRDLDLRTPDDY